MKKNYVQALYWGFIASFLGSLPLGTMNVTAAAVAVHNGTSAAFIYSAGSMLVELIYVRLLLMAMDTFYKRKSLLLIFEWVTIALLLTISVSSMVAAINMTGFVSPLPVNALSPFFLGMALSALNPLHLVFWFGWSTIFIQKKVLLPTGINYNFYVSGIGIGTISGFAVFIFGGNYLVKRFASGQVILNWIVGIILFITAAIQVYKIHRRKIESLKKPV